ncbi:MAG: ABC transporter permease [Verrucomicrobiota bacterium]|nr:ABC transporter permease [Verrucomicrobiota bacterium]
MNTQWRKILGDFRAHRLQIALIGLVLTLGAAGVVAALNARAVLQREIARSFAAAETPDIVLWFDKVDSALLPKVRAQPGVAEVDARRAVFSRIAGKNGKWFPMRLIVLRNFDGQRLGKIHQHDGVWPPADGEIFIEQSGRTMLDTKIGEELQIRKPSGGMAALPLAAFVHDPAVAPSPQDRVIYGYVNSVTASLIGQSEDLDQLLVRLKNPGDLSDTTEYAHELRDALKASGEDPLRADAWPHQHPHASLMATMLRVLQAFAAIAFVCGASLALYMVSIWMKREVRQVGIMKTLGARSHQLAAQYLGLVAPIVILANAIAFPLGAWLGRALVRYYQTVFNIDVTEWSPPNSLLRFELLFTFAIPLLAMFVPIARAARMTAHKAIQEPGIVAPGRTAKWIAMPGNRRWTFALRNTFRRPGRLAITLLTLSAGGALLLTADNTYESLMRVVDVSLGNQGHDIQVQLQRPAPSAELTAIARQVPEVEIAEAWRTAAITIGTPDHHESSRISLLGYPIETRLFQLPVKEGRLPLSGESDTVVINRLVQEALPNARVGSEFEIHFRDRRTTVRVVGVVEEIGAPIIYAASPTFEAITAMGDNATLLRVKTSVDAPDSISTALDQALLDAHFVSSSIQTRDDFRKALEEHFAAVTDVMRIVAVAAALVGAISLAASVGLNVLERAREIGVIRALGATPRAVRAMFLLESGTVALLSAIVSVIAGIVFTRKINAMASRDLLHVAVPLHISLAGIIALVGGVVILLLTVWVFLGRMLRLSVREVLAYE